MTDSNQLNKSLSRRNVIRFLAGVPALPLATGSVATLLTGCNDDDNNSGGSNASNGFLDHNTTPIKSVEFLGMDAPNLSNPANMATVYVGSQLKATFTDNTTKNYKLAYQPFFKTGDKLTDTKGNSIIAGGYFDINNKPIMDNSVLSSSRQFFSDCPDGSSLLTVKGAKVAGVQGNTVFAVVQFEYTTKDLSGSDMYGKLPSPIAIVTLDQNPQTGELKVVKYHNVDMSKVYGLWITCGASLSPWNTHLSSEEYEPDAFLVKTVADQITKNESNANVTAVKNNANAMSAIAQFKAYSKNLYGDENKANPYHYGHLPEVFVKEDGTGFAKKHFNLGRISHELIQVMPDKRTALMGDDFTNGGLFMFVADKEADLSAGNLYVAKITQTSPKDGPAKDSQFTVKWIHLGHATSTEIEALANSVVPTDILDVQYTNPNDVSYKKIGLDGNSNWVKLATNSKLSKEKLEQAAAFLETHRYAALKGASMAFTKMEGTTVNIKDKIAYSAMSRVEKSMTKGEYDVQVAQLMSGAVYAHELKGGQVDTDGKAINSEWVSTRMYVPEGLTGVDLSVDMKTIDSLGNKSDMNYISCPDNLKFSEKMRTLFIGEDSGYHVNNYLWAYNVDTKKLTRILSTPAGAESTGLHAVDEVNGYTYIMSNFQHPGDMVFTSDVESAVRPLLKNQWNNNYSAAVGYLTFKAN